MSQKKEFDKFSPYSFVAKEEKEGKKGHWVDSVSCFL